MCSPAALDYDVQSSSTGLRCAVQQHRITMCSQAALDYECIPTALDYDVQSGSLQFVHPVGHRSSWNVILVVLALPVHYYAHLNCESFRHVDFASLLFVSGTHVFR